MGVSNIVAGTIIYRNASGQSRLSKTYSGFVQGQSRILNGFTAGNGYTSGRSLIYNPSKFTSGKARVASFGGKNQFGVANIYPSGGYPISDIFYSFKDTAISINGNSIYANSVSLSQQANLSPSFRQGDPANNRLAPSSYVKGIINISYPITGYDHLRRYIAKDEHINGNLGGLLFTSGYLSSYSVSFSANETIKAAASIVFYSPIGGSINRNSIKASKIPFLNASDVALTGVHSIKQTINSFSYDVEIEIEPSFVNIDNNSSLKRVYVGKSSAKCQMQLGDFDGAMPASGIFAYANLLFRNALGVAVDSLYITGVISDKSINYNDGGLVNGSISFSQYNLAQKPIISGFLPMSQVAGGQISLSGENLNSVTNVNVGDCPAYFYLSDGVLKIKSPQCTGGFIYATNRGGISTSFQQLTITDGIGGF